MTETKKKYIIEVVLVILVIIAILGASLYFTNVY